MNLAKLMNTTCRSTEELVQLSIKKLLNNTLLVVERSSGQVNIVQEVIVQKDKSISFKFDDGIYSSSFYAVEVGVTKQIHFEW